MANQYIERRAQMFPKLTEAQIGRMASIGERRIVRAGQILYEPGDQNICLFVVIDGGIQLVRPVGDREEPVTLLGPGEFTGEINMLSARRSLVRARVDHRHRS
jgi:thioredoxin reductase (NADPH)